MFDEYPEAAPFLAAIRESPDDPTHRLVFSDWLEEHGDLRAAWLREEDIWRWMAPDVHDPVPPMIERFFTPGVYFEERQQLGAALRRIGPQAAEVIRNRVRQAERDWWDASDLLADIPPLELRPVKMLVRLLKGPSWVEALLALFDLRFHGPAAASAVSALMALNREEFQYDDSSPIRQAVYRALGAIGPGAIKAIPYLFGQLGRLGEDADVIASALRQMGPHGPEELLAAVYVGDHDGCGDRPLEVLADAHPDGLLVLARLLRRDPDIYLGPLAAARVIEGRAEEAVALVPVLVEVLGQTIDEAEREAIARALRKIGDPARLALPVLLRLFPAYESRPLVQHEQATWAGLEMAATLARLGEATMGLAHLRAGLTVDNSILRHHCTELLAAVAPFRPESLTDVLAATNDPEERVRSRAIWSLPSLMTDSVDLDWVTPLLLDALASPMVSVRSGAARCLGTLRATHHLNGSTPQDQTILTALLAAVDDPVFEVHSCALSGLGASTLPATLAEPLLALLAENRDPATNEMALRALDQVTVLPQECLAAAEALREHPQRGVRDAIARRLAREVDASLE